MGASRWQRPHVGNVFELTVLWPGMLAPVVFQAEAWKWEADESLSVLSGDLTPRVEVIPRGTPLFFTYREAPITRPQPKLEPFAPSPPPYPYPADGRG